MFGSAKDWLRQNALPGFEKVRDENDPGDVYKGLKKIKEEHDQ